MERISFGERVRAWRQQADPPASLRELAGYLGKSQTYMAKLERDEIRPPNREGCDALADRFDVDREAVWAAAVEELLEREPYRVLRPFVEGLKSGHPWFDLSIEERRLLEAARALDAAYPDDQVLERLARYLECSTDAGGVFILTRETTLILTETHAR